MYDKQNFIFQEEKMMKKKWMAPILALLLCVSMVGIGFAAWIITTPTDATANGQFQVYTVENNSVLMSAQVSEIAKITFGSPKSPATTTYHWLSLVDGAVENLSTTLTVTITNWATINQASRSETITLTISDFKIQKNVGTTEAADWQDQTLADYTDYVTFPLSQSKTITIKDGVVTSGSVEGMSFDATSGQLTFPLTFGWGQMFNSQNPMDYFNTKAAGAVANDHPLYESAELTDMTWMEVAQNALAKVSELNGDTVRYAMTVSADIAIAAN